MTDTKRNLNVHTAKDAAAAFRANRLEAMRLLENLLSDVGGRCDVSSNDRSAAGSMAALRIALEELGK